MEARRRSAISFLSTGPSTLLGASRPARSSCMRLTSSISGRFSYTTTSSNSTDAASALSAAFLALQTAISPRSVLRPASPSTTNLLFMFLRIYLPPELFGKIFGLVADATQIIEVFGRDSHQEPPHPRHSKRRQDPARRQASIAPARHVELFHKILHQLAALGGPFFFRAGRFSTHVGLDMLHTNQYIVMT